MKILVTGGAGFIGSHLVPKLIAQNFDTSVLDNLSSGKQANIPDKAQFFKIDINSPNVLSVFEREKFDAIVHLAGQTMVNVSMKQPIFDAEENIIGSLNLLEAARKTNVKRFVFASTAAVYGDVDEALLPLPETLPTNPMSFYGLSKATIEKYIRLYHDVFGLEYAILRFANVYGERQGDSGEGGVISIFTKRVVGNRGVTIYGDGEQTRDFIYAGDVADAIIAALTAPKVNDVYNISTQAETSVNDMLAILGEVAGQSIKVAHGSERAGDIRRSVLSNANATKKLGWQPKTSLKDGMERLYGYLKQGDST